MKDWAEGYVTDVGYTYGYYSELNPARIELPLLVSGFVPPKIETACELGFGQGLSVNIHAATTAVRWWANDFNPAHTTFARSLGEASGADVSLSDESFAEFTARTDLPDFDFIGLHGIWSWISDENRRVITDFIRRKLKPGGVVYISYNTLPGWAAMMPMRHLLTQHAEQGGGGIVSRIDGAIAFAEKLLASNPLYARANPTAIERFKKLKEQNRSYLAHEYFNRDWQPMHLSDMVEWLSHAKIQLAASAHYPDHLDSINLTPEHLQLLKEIPDPIFRQCVRDFCVNQQFRRDYWIKGGRRLTGLQQTELLRGLRFALVVPRADVALKTVGTLGDVTLSEPVYGPILDALASHAPLTMGEIEHITTPKGVPLARVVQALLLLIGKGDVVPVQSMEQATAAAPVADKLNECFLELARSSGDINFLASPVIGGGISVNRIQQLFLLARRQGRSRSADYAQFALGFLSGPGQKLFKEGKALETDNEKRKELEQLAGEFESKRLPVLSAMGVF